MENRNPRTRLRSRPYLFHLTLVAATVAAILLLAHVAMQFGTRHGRQRAVPELTGLPLVEAQELARRNGLEPIVNDSLFVPAYTGGTVLDQLPRPGVEVKGGRKIYLTINSFSQKKVQIPYVADRSLRQAKNMLEIAGLEIARLEYRPDMATNYVLEQSFGGETITPGSKTQAEIGSGITLHVGVAPEHPLAVVPKLIGYTLREAKSRLWEQGLNVGRIQFDREIDLLEKKDARVYVQTPGQSAGAPLGSEVSLQLTLDDKKVAEAAVTSDRRAVELEKERLRLETELRDSLARAETEARVRELTEERIEENDEEFF